MRRLIYTGLFALALTGLMSYLINEFAWMNPDSKLGAFEARHSGVTKGFRDAGDPELEANIKAFVACGRDCTNRGEIFAERERVVRRMWPAIFDRLVVDADWSDRYSDVIVEHDQFRLALRQYGAERLRNQCTPNIRYIWLGNTPQVERVWDYTCPG